MSSESIKQQFQSLPWLAYRGKVMLYLPKATLVLIIVLLSSTLAELTWSFFDKSSVSSNNSNKFQPTIKKPVIPSSPGLNSISRYHLFGEVSKQPVQVQKVIQAPETRLRLTLKGVFASSNPKNALAIISSNKGEDKTYHIGDRVTGGAELHSIFSDRVILQRNGNLETLRLPKPKIEGNAISTKSTSRSTGGLVNTRHASVKSDNLRRQQLREIRDTLVKNPSKLWKDVRINPVMRDGKVMGYTLAHNDRRLMDSLDLKPTDVITQVDGKDLSDPASLYGLLNSLSSKSSLDVTIERNGQQQMVQLNF